VQKSWIKLLYAGAGLYDGVLGLAFLFFGRQLFDAFEVTPPNHFGYVQFPALLLIVFAAMFFQIAANPAKNRCLIPYGIGLKLAYTGVVFWYALTAGIPSMWMPWAWADLAFLLLFVAAWRATGASEA
jgi:hypothetical protein